jgi:hypothetical protein
MSHGCDVRCAQLYSLECASPEFVIGRRNNEPSVTFEAAQREHRRKLDHLHNVGGATQNAKLTASCSDG